MLEDLQADVKAALSIANSASSAADANLTTISLLDKALNTVENSLGQVTLQEVLNNSNIADKDIVLTDGADDLIDISITEGRIAIASDTDVKAPKLTLAHQGEHQDGNRKADIELDEDGTRLDFEMSAHVKDVHFRFENDEKFILNHEGDAEFIGKVKVEPGTEGTEVVTYQQLAELDQEIEDIRPSIDRGEWAYAPGDSNIATGQYIAYKLKIDGTYCNELYAACLLAAGDDSDAKADCNRKYMECGIAADSDDPDFSANWEYCDFIRLHKTDVNGRLHTFSDAKGGMYVEIFNNDGSGFGLYQIIPNGVAQGGGQVIGLYVTHVHSEGTQNGNARVKLFEMASANPADYVKKAGDTMTGRLFVDVSAKDKSDGLATIGAKSGEYSSLVCQNSSKVTQFRVKNNGQVQAGTDASNAFMAIADNDVVTKKYLNASGGGIPGSPYVFTNKGKNDLAPGEMMKEGNAVHVSITDANGVTHYPDNDQTTWEGPWYVLKVYNSSGQKVIIHTGVKVYGKGKDGYLAWAVTSLLRNNDLTVGSTYYVADGLFLSY